MPDWYSSMQQTFEYYIVNPDSWKDVKKLEKVKSCTMDYDLDSETIISASIDCDDKIGENYIRAYLITIQNGIKDKYPLGTVLVQTPSTSFDGKSSGNSLDAYSPLLELKEKLPPIGYAVRKHENIMSLAYALCRENMRPPVTACENDATLEYDFVSDMGENWLSYLADLIANANYQFGLDDLGGIIFVPDQDIASLQPVWTYDDSNSSILYPNITMERDLYGIPNVVEVICSRDSGYYYSRVSNDDPNSPISTVNRGREVVHRETNPSFPGEPNQGIIDEYAQQLLRNLSCLEYTMQYTHGYCPVRIGDCVRLNYERAGITNVKAKVVRQSIKCEPGCPVTETAVFSTKLWG